KVASPDCASFVMLEELKTAFKRVIISTGMMYDNEIAQAAKIMGDTEFAFLHCVSIYPTPLNKLHLARMEWLRGFTSTVGFSDHSLVDRDGILASVAALAFGANIIERHFTLLPRGETRDGPVSINPEELGELVGFAAMKPSPVLEWCQSNIPSLSEVEGTANREMTDGELLNRDYYRGRFASSVDGRWVFNWEDEPVS
ncbi:MAG: N-acetylneuraminate synthase family protein, partial [Candidatus Latescibacteria bacterium]|nr:N-acetylneuraminate synthase family protein [Candidatus Latescibacterota bacterium]